MGEKLRERRRARRNRPEPEGRLRRWGVTGAGAAAVALVVAGAATVAGGGVAGADSALSNGSAEAQSLQVTPHDGSLAVGAIFGVAVAGVTGDFARVQSEGVDLGAIGIALKSFNCGSDPSQAQQNLVPSPLSTESGDPGAAQGKSQSPSSSDYFSNEYVLANTVPYGEADTTYGSPVADPTGAIAVAGMHSKAWSGVVNGVEETGASSDIAQLVLGAGAVVIDGLDWTTTYPTNGGGQPSGSFSIGSVSIGGVKLPSVADLSAVASAVNAVLNTLGLEIAFPQSSVQNGVQYVDPLQIEVVPNTTRDTLLQAAVNGAQPLYHQIANGLENGFGTDTSPWNELGQLETGPDGQKLAQGLCNSDTAITVADITIASLDGGGYFNVALGGVNSSDAPLAANPYSLVSLGLGSLSLPGTSLTLPGTAGTLGTTGTPPPTSTPSSTKPPSTALRAASARAVGSSPAGPLLAAGLGALGLLVLLVEGDRRLMRRAQRLALRQAETTTPPEG